MKRAISLLVVAAAVAAPATFAPAVRAEGDVPAVAGAEAPPSMGVALANGWFFAPAPIGLGYAVVDEPDGPPFWTSFQRLGGVDALGEPISRPFILPDARVYQATQHGLLAWRPGAAHADFADLLDVMSAAGIDDWLLEQGIPRPVPVPVGPAAEPALALAAALERLGWLTEPAIRRAYFGDAPDAGRAIVHALTRYGLPASPPERFEAHEPPHVTQRFQRGVLRVVLSDETDEAEPPTAGPVAVGELLRESGLIALAALAPDRVVGGTLVARAPRPQLAWRSDRGWGTGGSAPLPASAGGGAAARASGDSPAAASGTAAHQATPVATATPVASPTAATKAGAAPQPGAVVMIRAIVNQGRAEHAVIANEGTAAQELSGWALRSATGNQTYTFPAGFTLAAGASVSVHSGAGDPATLSRPPTDLYATRSNVWRNTGDVAQLLDPNRRLVHELSYGIP
ncbi:MAG: lamin tail domain-containing protein [Chloroflexi bacterium]|nr:lamin tail domain-containing protein [Chloroflexota bacterium]